MRLRRIAKILLGGSMVHNAVSVVLESSPSSPLTAKKTRAVRRKKKSSSQWGGRRRTSPKVAGIFDERVPFVRRPVTESSTDVAEGGDRAFGGASFVSFVPRGGSEGEAVVEEEGLCLNYLSLGMVHLTRSPGAAPPPLNREASASGASESESESETPSTLTAEAAIRSLLSFPTSSPSGSDPRIVCIPAPRAAPADEDRTRGGGAASSYLVGTFPPPSRQFDVGASHETLGCLSDVVVLRLTDLGTVRDEPNLLRIVDSVSGILDGAERRSASGGGGADGAQAGWVGVDIGAKALVSLKRRKQKLVILVDPDESLEKTRVVESVLGVQLDAIGEGGNRPKNGYNYVDLVVVTEGGSLDHIDALKRACGISDEVLGLRARDIEGKDVPLGAFPRLCGSVYRALGGAATAGVEFEIVEIPLLVAGKAGSEGIAEGNEFEAEMTKTEATPAAKEQDETKKSAQSSTATEEPPRPPSPPLPTNLTSDVRSALSSISDSVRASAEERLGALSSKMDEVEFDPEGKMPILEFGRDAESVLECAAGDWDRGVIESLGGSAIGEQLVQAHRLSILSALAGPASLGHLYSRQLQSLREYYGRKYERSLDGALEEYRSRSQKLRDELDSSDADGADEDEVGKLKMRLNAALGDAAGRAAEGFRTAASNAVPSQCCEGGALRDASGAEFGYASELAGLLRDIQDITGLRAEEAEIEDNEEGGGNEKEEVEELGVNKRKRSEPTKWYEKLVARALVLGVNYAQGWLALQGLRRAAAERDRAMPKFPLF